MAESKIYLNVPYAQKDAAKTLGARWDGINKKWYVPADIDLAPFATWQPVDISSGLASTATKKPKKQTPSSNIKSLANNGNIGTTTFATIKNFVSYNGDSPPWD